MSVGSTSKNTRILRGNAPLILDSGGSWIVEQGAVALFASPTEQPGATEGARRLLFVVSAGEAILWQPSSTRVLAVALEETQVCETAATTLLEAANAGSLEAQGMVTAWVRRFSLTASPETGGPEFVKTATSTHTESLDRASLRQRDPIYSQELLGQRQREFLRAALESFKEQDDEARRILLERQRASSEMARHAISALVAATPHAPRAGATRPGAETPLLAAARRVGEAQGMEIHAPRHTLGHRDPVSEILDASHARGRRVFLSGKWWTTDAGPLLAFQAETRTPVALIPARRLLFSGIRYELFEGSAEPVAVDPVVAQSLDPEAWMFYPPLPAKSGVLDLLHFAYRGRRPEAIAIVLTGLGATLLGMLAPIGSMLAFEYAVPDANKGVLLQIGAGLAAAAAGALLLDLARAFSLMRLDTLAGVRLETGVWDRLLKQSPAFFRRFSIGDLGSRASAISQLRSYLSETTLSSLFVGMISVLNLGLMLYYSASLALAACAFAVVAAIAVWLTGRALSRIFAPLQSVEGDLAGMMIQLVQAVPKLRIAGAEQRAFARWAYTYGDAQRLRQRLRVIGDRLRLFSLLMSPVGSAVLFALVYASATPLNLGSFVAFNAAFGAFTAGLVAIAETVPSVIAGVRLWDRMQPILESEGETDTGKTHPGELAGRVEIDHVAFRYRDDGPMTLDDVSLHAAPGECIAIVGPSGSGKSTIINLLLRFELPASGAIYLDGHDLGSLDIHAVRRQLGVVTQDNKIMAGSIFDNIVCGSLCTLAEAWDAARAAGFAADLEQMPMGLHTVISEGGANISGGQRQRLLIARALVQKPRILILDEATSALDNRTQAIVTESLDRLKVTRIMVAHRLSTVRRADRIYVVEAGRIVQSGKFEELLADEEGLFARLMRRQIV